MDRVWQGIELPEGVEIKEGGGAPCVGIRFRYRGVRCREWALPLTDPKTYKRVIALAADKLATIRLEIELGKFRYGDHFPDSSRRKIFGSSQSRTRTLKIALLEYLDAIEQTTESATSDTYKRIINNVLIPRLGKNLVVGFTALEVADFIMSLGKRGLVGKTVRNILLPLRGAFDREVLAQTVPYNPVRQIRVDAHLPPASRKHQVPLPQPFNEAERAAILAVAGEQMRNMCVVWWGTGMAEGEMLGLQWPSLNFVTGKIRLNHVMEGNGTLRDRMKTQARHRELDMAEDVRAALVAQKRFTFVEDGHVFVNPVTTRPWSNGKALTNYQWRTLLKRAGVSYRGPNQCRHTYAAIRITRGDNLWKIADALGHRGLEMLFKHYGSIIDETRPTENGGRVRRAG